MFEMTENEFNECEQAERIKHDEKVKELEAQNKNLQEMLQATRETRVNADYLKKIAELEAQIEKMKCCGNCRFSESDKLNGTFCHREGCFVVASAKCKLWED